jgi:release factor glutamine methyltransferase
MSTVLETIEGGTRYLEKRGIEDARRNMQHLVAHSLGCTRMALYLQFDRPLTEPELAPLRDLLKKRGEGIPLQHLLGTVPFLRRDFKTDARALIPRPETEELAELILRQNLPESLTALDMGCGSGVLGLTLAAERPHWQLTLADVSPDALALTRENLNALNISNANPVESDLFANLPATSDLIVANLPYVPESDRPTLSREVLHDPALALFSGPDGLDLLRRFIPQAFTHLNPGGLLALEIGHDQSTTVTTLLHQAGFTQIQTHPDLSGIPRFPTAQRPK